MFYKGTVTVTTLVVMASSLNHHWLSWVLQQKCFTWATTFTMRWGNFAVHVCRSYERGVIPFYNIMLQCLRMSTNCNRRCNMHLQYYKSMFLSKFISAHYGINGINTFAVYCSYVKTLQYVYTGHTNLTFSSHI